MNPRMTSKNWINFPGVSESQHSLECDSESCVSFSACHVLESQIQFLTGQVIKLSPRFLAYVSNTTSAGNTFQKVFNAILQYGICTEDTWPLPMGTGWNWEDFYVPPPPEAFAEALWFKNQYTVTLQANIGVADLSFAPLWTEVNLGYTTHAVEQINATEELDSEPNLAPPGHGGDQAPYIKPLSPVVNQNLLLLTQKVMSNVEFVQKAGTQEYGFYTPCLSPDALKNLALNYGINIQNADGSVNFAEAKQVTGL